MRLSKKATPLTFGRPHENKLRFLYTTRSGNLVRRLLNRRWFSQLMGNYHDLPISKRLIPNFVHQFQIDMSEAERPLKAYTTFNDFFTRRLKIAARPIDKNQHAITSPADSSVVVIESLEASSRFPIKGVDFNLATFLQNHTQAEKYLGGTAIIFRLGPGDYHRYHFPIACIPSPSIRIAGRYDSVDPIVFNRLQPLHTNERRLITLSSTTCGDILMVPVGALCVGKIVDTYQPLTIQAKGDEAGYFCFGGSTIVLIFEPQKICLDPQLKGNSRGGIETKFYMGQAIGYCNH